MLKLKGITKKYKVAGGYVEALKGLDVCFRKNEFVSILGPSGCGKTTTLNIVGGLDKYTSGDLIIAGKSTKNFKDRDWDVYRNHRIGFIFQSYNLIPHQTVLGNVELALTISGVSKEERIRRALNALEKVGLKGEEYKRPNQLSGGQCQRVAIARALVNEPDILLADEPTGALDSKTSVQIMELIKEISKDKLVIMVTHNGEIAEQYSTRIVRLVDGEIIEDTNPFSEQDELEEVNALKTNSEQTEKTFQPVKTVKAKKTKKEKAKMSYFTAFKLSLRNLFTKRGRTVLTSFAGSIGIIGISAVIAVSTGVRAFIANMQDDMLSGNPITIQETALDFSSMMDNMSMEQKVEMIKKDGYVNVDNMVEYLAEQYDMMDSLLKENDIRAEYVDYVRQMPKEYGTVKIDYGIDVTNNIYTDFYKDNQNKRNVSLSSIKQIYTGVIGKTSLADQAPVIATLGETFMQAPSDRDYILTQYDLLTGDVASNYDEIMIVVNKDRALTDLMLGQLGYYSQDGFLNIVNKVDSTVGNEDPTLDKSEFSYQELMGKEFIWYDNDTVFGDKSSYTVPAQNGMVTYVNFGYNYDSNSFTKEQKDNGVKLKIVGILQPKEEINFGCLQTGIYYTGAFSEYVIEKNYDSEIASFYRDKTENAPEELNYVFSTYDYTFEYEGSHTGKAQVGKYNSMMSMFSGGTPVYQLTSRHLGGEKIANDISIYPADFEMKDRVTEYLDKWNEKGDIMVNGTTYTFEDRIETDYTDTLSLIIAMINTMIDVVTYALISFTSLSLVVSCVMIAIITYVSVVERVKEIGVIRALGGRKRDVSNLFNAETLIIGAVSGGIGVGVTYLLSFIVNLIVKSLAGFKIMILPFGSALIMVGLSVGLTVLSGLIPSRKAAQQDPVVALRTE